MCCRLLGRAGRGKASFVKLRHAADLQRPAFAKATAWQASDGLFAGYRLLVNCLSLEDRRLEVEDG